MLNNRVPDGVSPADGEFFGFSPESSSLKPASWVWQSSKVGATSVLCKIHTLRKRRQAGSIPAVKLGLKNADENAMPRADARTILCDIVDATIKGHTSLASISPKENE
jgi:hypothetical protein